MEMSFFFDWLILEAWSEIQKKIVHFLVQKKTLKFAYEIYWPLDLKLSVALFELNRAIDNIFVNFCDFFSPWATFLVTFELK